MRPRHHLRFGLDGLEHGDIVGWDVSLLLGGLGPGEPPVTLRVVDDLQVLPCNRINYRKYS